MFVDLLQFFNQGYIVCDFLFAFLYAKSLFENRYTLKGKNLLPLGANSFLLEYILFKREQKQF